LTVTNFYCNTHRRIGIYEIFKCDFYDRTSNGITYFVGASFDATRIDVEQFALQKPNNNRKKQKQFYYDILKNIEDAELVLGKEGPQDDPVPREGSGLWNRNEIQERRCQVRDAATFEMVLINPSFNLE